MTSISLTASSSSTTKTLIDDIAKPVTTNFESLGFNYDNAVTVEIGDRTGPLDPRLTEHRH
jgi:hypothetical protein